MAEIVEVVRQAIEVGWPFVLTGIVVALALYTRDTVGARVTDLQERIHWLEANCLGVDGAVGSDPTSVSPLRWRE
jgi:hypothetical protein